MCPFLTKFAFAHDLKGTVIDESGVPIEGVSIVNQTTGGYAFSNVSGYFELDEIELVKHCDMLLFYL